MELAWVAFAQVVFPILVDGCVVALSSRQPSLGSHPFQTAFVLYILLLVLTAPGYDMWVPLIEALVSFAVAIAVFTALRQRSLAATRSEPGPRSPGGCEPIRPPADGRPTGAPR